MRGSSNPQTKQFLELKKDNGEPPANLDHRYITIKEDNFIYSINKNAINNQALSIIVILDLETITFIKIIQTTNATYTLQLFKFAVMYLSKMSIFILDSFLVSLKNLLNLDSLLFC